MADVPRELQITLLKIQIDYRLSGLQELYKWYAELKVELVHYQDPNSKHYSIHQAYLTDRKMYAIALRIPVVERDLDSKILELNELEELTE